MRHVALAPILGCVLACSSCSSCREDNRHAPIVDASPSRIASASASASAVADAAPTSADAPWELVAKRKSSDRPLWIAEVGRRVIVGDRTPLAWADGAEPLVAAPRIESDYIVRVVGTYPSAVFVASDKRVHRLVGEGWKDVGPLPPLTWRSSRQRR